MKLVDVNVLLYAIDLDAQEHKRLRSWLEEALSGKESLGLPWSVILGFVRISTNPRAFTRPIAVDKALEYVDSWLAEPNVQIVVEPDDHWHRFKELIAQVGTAGNLTTDAHLAAIAISLNATLVSCDADFRRFRRLHWENPLD